MPAKKPSKSSVKKPVRKAAKRGSKVQALNDHERRIALLKSDPEVWAAYQQLSAEIKALADGYAMLLDTWRQEVSKLRKVLDRFAQGQSAIRNDMAPLTASLRQPAGNQSDMRANSRS